MTRNQYLQRMWLGAHAVSERAVAGKIARFFSAQLVRILHQLGPIDAMAPSIISVIFNIDAEHKRFMRIVEPHLLTTMVAGYDLERRVIAIAEEDQRKSIAGLLGQLPAANASGMVSQLHKLVRKEYWRNIQRGTKTKLSEIIANGINQGHPTPKIAKAIRAALGPETSKARALAVARSEVTGALNAGTYEAMRPMLERGVLSGREWATVGDDDVRETHVAMSGVVAHGDAMFVLPIAGGGSESAPYPGHQDLSVGNRVNCRCCVLSILAPPPPKMKPPRVSKPTPKPARQPTARPVPLV